MTWDVFMDTFLESFLLVYIREKKDEEFQDLHQYAARFVQLSHFAPLIFSIES